MRPGGICGCSISLVVIANEKRHRPFSDYCPGGGALP
jgi:hypothetical protein